MWLKKNVSNGCRNENQHNPILLVFFYCFFVRFFVVIFFYFSRHITMGILNTRISKRNDRITCKQSVLIATINLHIWMCTFADHFWCFNSYAINESQMISHSMCHASNIKRRNSSIAQIDLKSIRVDVSQTTSIIFLAIQFNFTTYFTE